MKVLMITRLYPPHVGGVEKQVKELSKRLVDREFDISVITEKYKDNLRNEEIVNGVRIIRLSYPKIKFLGLLYIWAWFFKNFSVIEQADIIHTHGVFIWYWPFRFIFPKKPVYTTFHGWEGVYPIPKKNIFLRRIAAKLAWKNITIGKFVEKHYGIKADKILYTSVDSPKKIKIKKDRRSILYVGRLDADTGIEKILKALSYIEGYKIDFCGDGPLLGKCKKLGNVHGFVNPNPYYEKAFICLSPGHTSILEAFTYKCLIVTTYDSPVKKDYLMMTPFSKWIVIEKSPKRLAEKIDYYSRHPDRAKDMIENAYKWVLKQNWDNATDTYLRLWGVE